MSNKKEKNINMGLTFNVKSNSKWVTELNVNRNTVNQFKTTIFMI